MEKPHLLNLNNSQVRIRIDAFKRVALEYRDGVIIVSLSQNFTTLLFIWQTAARV